MIVSQEKIFPLGDTALTVRLAEKRSDELLTSIHAIVSELKRTKLENVQDIVPSYLGVTLFYDPHAASYSEMQEQLSGFLSRLDPATATTQSMREHVIRVRYNGPDLDEVARRTNLSRENVIAIHTARTYRVDLLGFVPGWAYLSGLDQRLELPRRDQPRPKVKAGSVAIAALQTGIYPLDTPGGWHVLGSTEAVMFDAMRESPALFAPGDTVRFVTAE